MLSVIIQPTISLFKFTYSSVSVDQKKEKKRKKTTLLDCISYLLPVPSGTVCDVAVILALRH